ncbi:MAG: phosphomannomutase [Verrucomicrobiota bacterium]
MSEKLSCFKAYDIRGRVPEDLNEDLAYSLGRAYAVEVRPDGPVAVGRDVRQTSQDLATALIRGLNDGGVDTRDIGLCGTEMVYFAAGRPGMGGGIMVTASHNPMQYNGFKLVRADAVPISGDSGLKDLEERVRTQNLGDKAAKSGTNKTEDIAEHYTQKVISFVDVSALKPLRIVVNAGNGCAGPFLDRIADHLPFEFIRVNHEPDGTFPNGIPNPLLEENQPVTANAVREHKADLGIAWDGDFDRCFFFDETGAFADGYYIVGLLAKRVLKDYPGAKIIHDPRMTWNTIATVKEAGGTPVQWKTGHAFMKEKMRKENAAYGGEMSAHHYFRDFTYCDSGMIPWLLIAALMCENGKPLSQMVAEGRQRFPGSGEINTEVENPDRVIETIRKTYADAATRQEEVDGLSMEFGDRWRFNVRKSQTEPILRLNIETAADPQLLEEKTRELVNLVRTS